MSAIGAATESADLSGQGIPLPPELILLKVFTHLPDLRSTAQTSRAWRVLSKETLESGIKQLLTNAPPERLTKATSEMVREIKQKASNKWTILGALQLAVSLEPGLEKYEVLLMIVQELSRNGYFFEAKEVAKIFPEASVTRGHAFFAVAQELACANKLEEAIETVKSIRPPLLEGNAFLLIVVKKLLKEGRDEKAKQTALDMPLDNHEKVEALALVGLFTIAEEVAARNTNIKPYLAIVKGLVETGNFAEGARIAKSMPISEEKVEALVLTNSFEEAKAVAESEEITEKNIFTRAEIHSILIHGLIKKGHLEKARLEIQDCLHLAEKGNPVPIISALLSLGDIDEACKVACAHKSPIARTAALSSIAYYLVDKKDLTRAKEIANMISSGFIKDKVLFYIIKCLLQANEREKAQELAAEISPSLWKIDAYNILADHEQAECIAHQICTSDKPVSYKVISLLATNNLEQAIRLAQDALDFTLYTKIGDYLVKTKNLKKIHLLKQKLEGELREEFLRSVIYSMIYTGELAQARACLSILFNTTFREHLLFIITKATLCAAE